MFSQGDYYDWIKLRATMGNVLRPAFGTPDGYYCLDLKKELDRACLSKLMDLSTTISRQKMLGNPIDGTPSQSMKLLNQDGLIGDTSQKGNWGCFRNEFFQGQNIEITPELFIPMPTRGQLEFDFVSGMRPPMSDESVQATDDAKFLRVLGSCCLVKNSMHSRLLTEMRTIKENCRAITKVPTGSEGYHARTIHQSDLVFAAMERFSNNLANRFNNIALGGIAAEVKFDYLDTMSSIAAIAGTKGGGKIASSSGYEATDSEEEEEEEKMKKVVDKSRKTVRAPARMSMAVKRVTTIQAVGGSSDGSASTGRKSVAPGLASVALAASEISKGPIFKAVEVGYAQGPTPANREDIVRDMTTETAPKYMFEDTDHDVYPPKKPAAATGAYRRGNVLLAPGGHPAGLSGGDKPGMLGKQGSFKKQSGLDQLRGSRRKSSMSEVFVKAMVKRVAYKKMLIHPAVSEHAKANRALDQLEEALGRIWLTSVQLAMVMYTFQQGSVWRAENFGTYRVELVITLLHRVLDLHNFDVVLHFLTTDEIACLYCRVGLLNLYNPMKPEVSSYVHSWNFTYMLCVFSHWQCSCCLSCTNMCRAAISLTLRTMRTDSS
jgi:hypothetical protein